MLRDAVIGYVDGYGIPQIKNWVNSLVRSGFEGDKLMIWQHTSKETLEWLTEKGFQLVTHQFGSHCAPVVARFVVQHHLFSQKVREWRYVVATDVKDVVFQKDPTQHLRDLEKHSLINFDGVIIAGSENVIYEDEAWGRDNMQRSFPFAYSTMKDKVILNAGTLAGTPDILAQLFMQVFLLSLNNPVHNPDQAALNVLLRMTPFKKYLNAQTNSSGWCAQLGTNLDPTKKFDNIEPLPRWLEDGTVVTASGYPFYLVHQYDRVPGLKELIDRKYD